MLKSNLFELLQKRSHSLFTYDELHIRSGIELPDYLFKPAKLARWSNEATKIRETVFEKDFNDFCSDKTAGSSDQNQIVL
jgi:hypothetical protein